jgi:hypothetical protein
MVKNALAAPSHDLSKIRDTQDTVIAWQMTKISEQDAHEEEEDRTEEIMWKRRTRARKRSHHPTSVTPHVRGSLRYPPTTTMWQGTIDYIYIYRPLESECGAARLASHRWSDKDNMASSIQRTAIFRLPRLKGRRRSKGGV